MLTPYSPEPYSDFAEEPAESQYRAGIDLVGSELGDRALLVIGGERIDTGNSIDSVNPAEPTQRVGTSASAGKKHVDQAVDAAWSAYETWSRRTPEERAGVVHRIGDIMAERKFELAAWQTYEAGKNWAEAEADVLEAVDFCRFYAHEALRLSQPIDVVQVEGEVNESFLQPMGAGVAIPPWNFPLAIPVGMVIGPVAAGNTVVMKPASNTPLIAWQFMKIVEEAGLPAGVINFLPGSGGEIGDALVDHPRTRFVNFTGSKEVGLRIAERSAKVHEGQKWLKRSW